MEIKKVAVIGSGIMGNQIAMQCAIYGYDVWNYDVKEEMVKTAEEFADHWFAGKVKKGKLEAKKVEEIRARIHRTTDIKIAAEDADLVIEAVPDRAELKKQVLSQVDAYTPEHTIYGSNSSYLVSSLFADAIRKPERITNLHFFNPALIMPLVEIVKGPHVSQNTVDFLREFALSIGKTPILVNKEIYGFVANRIFSAMTKEACYLLDQGIASAEDIDLAVRNGLGHPMGPLELLDMTGIDLEYSVLMERYQMTGNLEDKPSPSIVEHYAKGEFGRKTQQGFYRYGQEGK